MNDRLEFANEAFAQAAADAIHVRMQLLDPDYASSVAKGHTTAWAIPYQDEKTLLWCVNVKDRGRKACESSDLTKLKAFAVKEVAAVVQPKVR